MKLVANLFLLALLLLSGCAEPEVKKSASAKPEWILNPSQNGKIGAVGSAYRHPKGLPHQRKIAITRALDELALQQGVKVSLSMSKSEQVINDRASMAVAIDSEYTASSSVTAHIEQVWQDPYSQELFVWLLLD